MFKNASAKILPLAYVKAILILVVCIVLGLKYRPIVYQDLQTAMPICGNQHLPLFFITAILVPVSLILLYGFIILFNQNRH